MKKFIACLLVLMTLITAIACTKSENNPDQTSENTEGKADTTDGASTSEEEAPPSIPDTVTGNGSKIVIQTEGWANYSPLDILDIGITEMNNDGINDAAYTRDRRIEETLDVEIEVREYGHYPESYQVLSDLVSSGDCDIDFCVMRSAIFTTAITNDLLVDLNTDDLVYFDPDKSWWDRNSYDSLSIANIHYGITGDFTTADDLTYWCVYFNKQINSDLQLENPYEIVKNGEWTYDKMFEMASKAAKDLDGIDGMTDSDQWGVSMIRDILGGALNTVGINIVEKDENDLPYLSFKSESNISKMQHLLELFYNDEYVYCFANRPAGTKDEVSIFTSGNTLFTIGGVYYGPQMRNSDTEFGMLPMPKYDSSQEYISATSPLFLSILCTPKTNKDNNELKGAFMELYSYLGSELVVPEFYDRLLKWKVASDDESREMMDYIFNNTAYDIGGLFNFGDISFLIIDMMYTKNTNIVSMWDSNEVKVQQGINDLLTALQNNS